MKGKMHENFFLKSRVGRKCLDEKTKVKRRREGFKFQKWKWNVEQKNAWKWNLFCRVWRKCLGEKGEKRKWNAEEGGSVEVKQMSNGCQLVLHISKISDESETRSAKRRWWWWWTNVRTSCCQPLYMLLKIVNLTHQASSWLSISQGIASLDRVSSGVSSRAR